MPKFDHHLHTSRHSPDSAIAPEELLRRAAAVGLDGVVMTDHDYQWNPDELAQLAEQGKALGIQVFTGAEVSRTRGISSSTVCRICGKHPPGCRCDSFSTSSAAMTR